MTSVGSRIFFQNYAREREMENLEEQGEIMRKVDGHHKLELTCAFDNGSEKNYSSPYKSQFNA